MFEYEGKQYEDIAIERCPRCGRMVHHFDLVTRFIELCQSYTHGGGIQAVFNKGDEAKMPKICKMCDAELRYALTKFTEKFWAPHQLTEEEIKADEEVTEKCFNDLMQIHDSTTDMIFQVARSKVQSVLNARRVTEKKNNEDQS